MSGGRRPPVRHTVHTHHPRYEVPRYNRGSGLPVVRLRTQLDVNNQVESIEEKIKAPSTSATQRLRLLRKLRRDSEIARQRGDEETTAALIEAHDDSIETVKRRLSEKVARLPDNSLEKARIVHELRTIHAQRIDNALESGNKPGVEDWVKSPNRADIRGVDYFPVPLAQDMPTLEDNFQVNNKLVKTAYEDYFGLELPDSVKFRQAKRHEEAPGQIAYYTGKDNEIVYGKDWVHILKNGKIESGADFKSIQAMAHEIGHAIRGNKMEKAGLGTRHPYYHSEAWIEEGSNEIAAERFSLNSFQIPDNVRRGILANPFKGTSYQEYQLPVADMSLLINDGDEHKAVKWIERLRTEPDHKKFIAESTRQSNFLKPFKTNSDDDNYSLLTKPYWVKSQLESKGVKDTMGRPFLSASDSYENSNAWFLLVS